MAQVSKDSIYVLPEVCVEARKDNSRIYGVNRIQLDSSLMKSGNIGDLLSANTPVFVKSSGPGNLASISLRGCSAQQAAILWNGFDLKASGAGMIDLSLIPAMLFNSVEVIYGGNSAIHGSGAIGGSIILDSDHGFTKKSSIRAGVQAGSFHTHTQFLSVSKSTNSFFAEVSAFHAFSRNDFDYTFQNNEKTNNHARLSQYGLIAELGWRPGKRHQISCGVWLQDSDREIPPSLTSISLNATRYDRSFRIVPQWKYFSKAGTYRLKLAWFNDDLYYIEKPESGIISIDSRIHNYNQIAEAGFNRMIGERVSLDAGWQSSISFADINKFGGKNYHNQHAAWISMLAKTRNQKLKSSINLRVLVLEDFTLMPVPSLGVELVLPFNLEWKASVSANYRLPALNDLYWQPGGNLNLLPEKSKNAETGFVWRPELGKRFKIQFSSTVFYSHVTDWIAWIPGTSYFSAANIRQVEMKGIENGFGLEFKSSSLTIKGNTHHAYIISQYRNKLSVLDQSNGKQLIYTPLHRFSGNIFIQWKGYHFRYTHGYTGLLYVTSDNSSSLPPWWTGNLSLSGDFRIRERMKFQVEFEIRNLWDAEYQVVQYYPMPGRGCFLNVAFMVF